jgi:hypothetical protein
MSSKSLGPWIRARVLLLLLLKYRAGSCSNSAAARGQRFLFAERLRKRRVALVQIPNDRIGKIRRCDRTHERGLDVHRHISALLEG